MGTSSRHPAAGSHFFARLACDDTLAALHLSQVCIGMGLPLDREGGSMGLPMMELPNFS